jgi:hypothetical protein
MANPTSSDPISSDPTPLTITLLLTGAAPLRVADLETALPQAVEGAAIGGFAPGLPAEDSDSGLAFSAVWGDHRILCLQVLVPAPGLQDMIKSSRMGQSSLPELAAHASHVLCIYKGTAVHPSDRIWALFQLAAACRPLGLIGIIHTDAWQCFHVDQLGRILDPGMAEALRGDLAHRVFCNLIPFHGPDGTWWTSKGNHVFDIPDVALWDDGRFGGERAYAIHAAVFSYLRGGAVMKPGSTMEHDGVVLAIGEVTEHRDFLAGPDETIALRPVGTADGGGRGEPGGGARPGRVLPVLATLFFAGLIFGVPPHYTGMRIALGVVAGICALFAVRAFLAQRS